MGSYTVCFGAKLLLVALFVFIICIVPGSAADNTNTTSDQNAQSDEAPLERGIQWLYDLTNGFINIVQPTSSKELLEKLQLDLPTLIQSQGAGAVPKLTSQWQTIIQHYQGLAACLVIGLLYFILMPLVGIIFCICRCCGKCGGRPGLHEGKNDKCLRGCCGITLGLLSTVALAAAVCVFLSNQLLFTQTSDSSRGAMYNVDQSLGSLETYRDNSLKELEKALIGNFKAGTNQVLATLNNAPEESKTLVNQLTDAEPILQAAENLVNSLDEIQTNLTAINQSLTVLQDLQPELERRLEAEQTDTTNSIAACSTSQCDQVRWTISNLTLKANFSKLTNVEKQLIDITDVLSQNISKLVNQGRQEYENISERVKTKIHGDVQKYISVVTKDVQREVDVLQSRLDGAFRNVSTQVNKLVNFNSTRKQISSDIAPEVKKYGDYRWYAGIGIGCVLLLIIFCYYLGLLSGCCGEAPYEDSHTCNRAVGSSFLMAGVYITLILCWILMLVTVLLFLFGGLTHSEVCRPLKTSLSDNILVTQVADSFLNGTIRIGPAIEACKEGKSLDEAINFDSIYNLSEYTDLSKYNLDKYRDDIKNRSIDLSNINILNSDTRQQLTNLENSGLEEIDFQKYGAELSKQITTDNLTDIAILLRNTAAALTDPTQSSLERNADNLEAIDREVVQKMAREANILSASLNKLENAIDGTAGQKTFRNYTRDLINRFDEASNVIQVNGSAEIKKFIGSLADRVFNTIQGTVMKMLQDVRTDVGKCRPVYDAVESLVDVACVDVLYPFNSFWFSLAACLGIFLPCLFFACFLATLYKKSEEYDPDNKSFDDPRYLWMREQQSSLLGAEYPRYY